jgi:DNA mismatch repair protein MutL
MGRIHLLDDQLINKIAAGEVVERPASVVKELVENSIDAGASKISVELTEGGRKRLLISDDGVGMESDDALLSIKRHATSKISSDEDLFRLTTMGFRGEALASIAAVSKFTMMTCPRGSDVGVRLSVEGGSEPDVTSWQSEGGTTIVIDDLFFNVPARSKFLKTASTEYACVLELMQSLALAHPWIDFSLSHNGKEVLKAPRVVSLEKDVDSRTAQGFDLWKSKMNEESLRARLDQVVSVVKDKPMVFVRGENTYGEFMGLISTPGVERPTSRDMFLYVNGRLVHDKSLKYAVMRGYHSHLMKGKYPVVAGFLWVDPGLVDVNVHPSKTEVRLQFASDLHGMIAMAIREGLRGASWSAPYSTPYSALSPELPSEKPHESDVKEESPSLGVFRNTNTSFSSSSRYPATSMPPSRPVESAFETSRTLFAEPSVFESRNAFNSTNRAESETSAVAWSSLEYFGAVSDCYLLFRMPMSHRQDRLLVVDQHAFHERIIYEKLCSDSLGTLKVSQPFLVPEALEMDIQDAEALRTVAGDLKTHGFHLEFLGEGLVEVHALPFILAKSDPEALLTALAKDARRSTLAGDVTQTLAHGMLSTIACHSAVRAGESLGDNELRSLISEASTVDFYHNCPHGRRVFRWWDTPQIARWFDR